MAAAAGLDFWAFMAYQKGHPMHLAFQHYLQSQSASKINFSLICSAGRFMNDQSLIDDHSKLLAHPGYQKSATGLPLYSIFISNKGTAPSSGMNKLQETIEAFRMMARNKSRTRVEIAALLAPGTEPSSELMRAGFDAVGHYSIVCSRAGSTFRDLTSCAEAQWQKDAMTYRALIPTVMTGWDRRPRMNNPVPWESRPTRQGISFNQPSAAAFHAHVGNALRFAVAHPATPAILIYAWNEFDEGGWLYPTLADDFDRLGSLKIALRSASKGSKESNCSGESDGCE
ncbi:glycoside hydrolase family 99-like domain-containing protein [Sphingobium abikonense]|uniref:glycoside hydrolase family 99-like domain-containing protein n=1 Tax=Sphingobium abikonense TaxID=86193 RepID=UPI001471A356|nr:glycoside hydrolase family 99-like domain-containing protein [Sphingobium abikonense]